MDWQKFSSVDFVPPLENCAKSKFDVHGFVYVWCFVLKDKDSPKNEKEVPFYVGQTYRLWGRIDDYYWASFQAPTDFKVGKAIQYLAEQKFKVRLKHSLSEDRLKDEAELIESIGKKKLLNGILDHECTAGDEKFIRGKIKEKIEALIREAESSQTPLSD